MASDTTTLWALALWMQALFVVTVAFVGAWHRWGRAKAWIVGFLAFGWFIFLLVTTAQSPTKQGWHDKFANTQVVKAAKTVG